MRGKNFSFAGPFRKFGHWYKAMQLHIIESKFNCIFGEFITSLGHFNIKNRIVNPVHLNLSMNLFCKKQGVTSQVPFVSFLLLKGLHSFLVELYLFLYLFLSMP